jgi:hypothetical protein
MMTRTAALSSVTRRRPSLTSPTTAAPLNYKGQELELAGWIKTSKSGDSYMSLEVKEKEPYQEKTSVPLGDFDKDLPF